MLLKKSYTCFSIYQGTTFCWKELVKVSKLIIAQGMWIDPRETNIIQKHKPIMLPLAGVFPWTRGQASKTLGWTAMRSAGDLGDRRDQAVGAAATWLQLMVPCVVSASDFHSWIWILMLEMWIFVNLLILMLATESHCKKYCGGQTGHIWELVWPVDLVYAQSKH